MRFEVYVDVYFLYDFILNLCALFITQAIWNHKRKPGRHIASAAVGATISLLYLAPIPCKWVIKYIVLLPISSWCMLFISFGKMKSKQVLFLLISAISAVILLGGMISRLLFFAPGNSVIWCFISMIGFTFLFCSICKFVRKRRKKCMPVSLYTEGGVIGIYALVDSGNGLRDRNTGRGVCVLEKGICDINELKSNGSIHYSTIGKKEGILSIFIVKKATIHTYFYDITCKDMVIAIYEGELSKNHKYQMILHEDYLA